MKVPLGPVTIVVMPAIALEAVRAVAGEVFEVSNELPANALVGLETMWFKLVTRLVSFFDPLRGNTEAVTDAIGVRTVIGGLPEGDTTTGSNVRVEVELVDVETFDPVKPMVEEPALGMGVVTLLPSGILIEELLPSANDVSGLNEKPYPGGMPAEGPFGKGSFVTYTEGVETFPPP